MMMVITMTTMTTMVLDLLGLHLVHFMIFCCIILPSHHHRCLTSKLNERQLLGKKLQFKKVKFTGNVNKLFSKADEIFNKNNEQKLSFDDAESLSKPDEMTIPQAQVI